MIRHAHQLPHTATRCNTLQHTLLHTTTHTSHTNILQVFLLLWVLCHFAGEALLDDFLELR